MPSYMTLALAFATMPMASLAAPAAGALDISTKPFNLAARQDTNGTAEEWDEGESIVGGTVAATAEFPYIVSLAGSTAGSHFCGGVLVNSNTVVTAAHCSVDQDATAVRVRAGSNLHASGGTLVRVSDIVVHPSYDADTTDNDVAVWHLSTAIPTSSTIAYVTLPATGSDPSAGTTLTVAGWGLLTETSTTVPSNLRKVDVPVISRTTCRSEYGTSAITTNMFCAGLAAGGVDSCQGDSGGPIVDASDVLQGVVSWGSGCARPDFAGVYTRLGNYVSWINSNLA